MHFQKSSSVWITLFWRVHSSFWRVHRKLRQTSVAQGKMILLLAHVLNFGLITELAVKVDLTEDRFLCN